jgi:PLP dependent protein
VTLVGVVKGVDADRVRQAVDLGLSDLGGNRVQDTLSLQDALERTARWHMIGNLQRNKAARAAERFDRVQTVDDLELARALSRHAVESGRRLPVLIQVNVSDEPQKHGVAPDTLSALVDAVAELPGLALDGVMSIGAEVERPEAARRYFVATRELRDRTERETGRSLPEMSMGMSGDFEVAVEEGSTMVRIGSALFGARL